MGHIHGLGGMPGRRRGDPLAGLAHTFTISSGLTKVTWLMCDAVMIRDIRDRAALLRVP